ncbi:MAG: lycopene beta-cyclase CrtY [Defluviimonas sp.]|nr:lycopene beta-cyclase CrtY [Defluviimonas sp.]
MERTVCDIAIVGGGLAGGLAALAIARARPGLTIRLIEAGEEVGGNHRWSWFASDLGPAGAALVDGLAQMRWEDGHAVSFPGCARHLPTPYRSLASRDFAGALRRALPRGTMLTGRAAVALAADGVALADGERIAARVVIDARGFAPTPHLTGGWQVFMGRTLRCEAPHGLTRPTIMDATVAQIGGYRFVYVLPLGPRIVFIEDTYYQDAPLLDRAALERRLDDYAQARGWRGEVMDEETGVLPVITGGDLAAFQTQHRVPGVAVIGARGGFVHPLTSYTLPFAVETALAIAEALPDRLAGPSSPGAELAALVEARARRHWRAMRFYRLLGAMLFGAAAPAERWRIFARFYTLPTALIERFYAGRSTLADRARILCGRPPVPVGRALRALATPNTALKDTA